MSWPGTWRLLRLDQLLAAPMRNGRSVPTRAGGFPVLRLTAIQDGRVDLTATKGGAWDSAEAAPFLASEGDLLVVRGNGSLHLVGRSGLVGRLTSPVAFPDTLIQVRANRSLVDARFLNLAFDAPSVRTQLESSARTTAGIYKINQTHLSSLLLPIPPLEEQQRIVAILDDHLSRLDAATSGARTSGLRLAALRLSALTTARNQLIDEGAVMRPLGTIAQTALGKMLDAKRAAGSPTPYLRNINVRWGSFELDDIQEVPLSTDERERLALQEGDLLVCEGGEPGRCAVWPGSESLVAYQKALHRVRAHDPAAVDTRFVAVMIEEFIKAGRADRMFTGTTIKHLPQEKLRKVELPIPTLERQRDVLRWLESLEEGGALLERELGKVLSRAASLRRSLLTAAFTGELTSGRYPNEEVA